MASWNTVRIGWQADLAVACVDGLTNRVIRDASLRVWAEGCPRPVRKPDGYYVFVGCRPGRYSMQAEAPFLERAVWEETFPAPEGGVPVRWVRLAPGRRYPFPADTVFLQGYAAPGSRITVTGGPPLRLGEDAPKGAGWLRLHGVGDLRLDGARFALSAKNQEGAPEELRLLMQQEDDPDCYRLESPLKKAAVMAQALLLPVAETQAGPDGAYWLPLGGAAGAAVSCSCFSPGGKRPKQQRLQLDQKENRLDF